MALYVEESYIPASLVQLCCDSFCAIRILHVFRKNKRASTCLLRRYEHGFHSRAFPSVSLQLHLVS